MKGKEFAIGLINVEVLPAETAESCFDGVHGLHWWSDGYYYCYDNQRYYGCCPTGLTLNQEKSKLGFLFSSLL